MIKKDKKKKTTTMIIVITTVVAATGIGIAAAPGADPVDPLAPLPAAAVKPSTRELDPRDMGRLPGDLTPEDEQDVANALAVAHHFLAAYMRYQAGDDSPEIAKAFRATVVDYMFEDLLAEPSIPRRGPYHLFRFNPELAGPAWIVIHGAYGDEHERAPYQLWLRKTDGRWEVTSDQIRQSQ
jgi:hypothetical protein